MDRISILLQRLTDNVASDKEVDELLALLQSGDEASRTKATEIMDDRFRLPRAESDGQTMHENAGMIRRILESDKKKAKAVVPVKMLWVVAILLLTTTIATVYYRSYREHAGQTIAEADNILTVTGRDFIHLPDGSTVLMNEGSELTYATAFGKNGRDVTLKGEAFFDVAHTSTPFRVHTGKVITTVLGTAFNVKTTSKDLITVTVVRGKVAVGDANRTFGTITPNEQFAIHTTNEQVVKTRINSESVTKWKEGYFVLDNVSFLEAASQIEKRFHVNIKIANPELEKCIVSAWFLNNEDLQQVVETVSGVQQATATVDGNEVIIDGGTGCGEE